MMNDELHWPPLVAEKFGEKLRELRKRVKVTQQDTPELAKQYGWVDLSERNLRRFEKGESIPSLDTLVVMLFLYRKDCQNQWPGIANELRRAILRDVVRYLRTAKPSSGIKQEPPGGPRGSLL